MVIRAFQMVNTNNPPPPQRYNPPDNIVGLTYQKSAGFLGQMVNSHVHSAIEGSLQPTGRPGITGSPLIETEIVVFRLCPYYRPISHTLLERYPLPWPRLLVSAKIAASSRSTISSRAMSAIPTG